MKKNKLRYVLGAALVGVWGLLGFRFYDKINKHNNIPPIARTEDINVEEPTSRSYSLSLDYEDPFQGKSLKRAKPKFASQAISSNTNARKRQKAKQKKVKKEPIFPDVIYRGNIKTEEGRQVALMNVNGNFIHLNKGHEFKELNLLQVHEDSIRVAFAGREKTIKRIH